MSGPRDCYNSGMRRVQPVNNPAAAHSNRWKAALRFLVPLVLLLLACRALFPTATPQSGPLSALVPPTRTPGSLTPTPLTLTPNPAAPVLTPTPVPPVLTPAPQASTPFAVHLHPDGPLYVGDQVSLEVIAPQGSRIGGMSVVVQVDGTGGARLGPVDFGYFGIGGRAQATMLWAWDTSGLAAGAHKLTFSIRPDGPTWTQTVLLNPQNQVPAPEPQAHWATAESQCCVLHYITGTAAERDLPQLLALADEQAQDVSRKFGFEFRKKIPITLLPRVLGHGGFTSQEISVSYVDRNYASSNFGMVLHHEMVHLMDASLGGDFRPTILVEGLAVYLTGGHFKPEPLLPRAAALLPPGPGCEQARAVNASQEQTGPDKACGMGNYLPLVPLVDDFYFSQHEIGYLEAGALVEFMVKTWGWQAFSDFYRDIKAPSDTPEPSPSGEGPQARVMEAALQAHFGLSLSELESRFLEALRKEPLSADMVSDVQETVDYYDTVRHYQQSMDPSAYFLTAWLADPEAMRKRGIVADYLRRPSTPENLAFETMLMAADQALQAGDYATSEKTLEAINAVLAQVDQKAADPFSASSLASDYLAVVKSVLSYGYQPQRIQLNQNTARVWASTSGPDLFVLSFFRSQDKWLIGIQAQAGENHGLGGILAAYWIAGGLMRRDSLVQQVPAARAGWRRATASATSAR